MTLAIERPVVAMGPTVPEADETCRTCGTNEHTVFVSTVRETVVELGEKPGLEYSWQCQRCPREWTTPVPMDYMACPAEFGWCTRHEADGREDYHASDFIPVTADRIGYGGKNSEALVVTATRSDMDGVAGEPVVFLLPEHPAASSVLSDALGFTPDRAREVAYALLTAAAQASGVKPAEDARPGDRIVIDGRAHTVITVLADVGCCDGTGECGGQTQIYTDLSEQVDECEPALIYEPGQLIPLERISLRPSINQP